MDIFRFLGAAILVFVVGSCASKTSQYTDQALVKEALDKPYPCLRPVKPRPWSQEKDQQLKQQLLQEHKALGIN